MSESYDKVRDWIVFGADLLTAFVDWAEENKKDISQIIDDLDSRLIKCENHYLRKRAQKDEDDCADDHLEK